MRIDVKGLAKRAGLTLADTSGAQAAMKSAGLRVTRFAPGAGGGAGPGDTGGYKGTGKGLLAEYYENDEWVIYDGPSDSSEVVDEGSGLAQFTARLKENL
jgi:hypothetical protein